MGIHYTDGESEESPLQTTDAEFVNAILNGGPVAPDFEEGVRYMEFTEAEAVSAHTGRVVTLPPEPTMESWGQPLASD